MDDSAMYTGVDGAQDGAFGNETVDESVQKALDEQKHQLAELTPKLQNIIDMLDSERAIAIQFIADYVDNIKATDPILRGELIATARYRKYLDDLKTKFSLALNETKK